MAKRNKDFANKYKGKPCLVCGTAGELDHIMCFKGDSRYDNSERNAWVLCRLHHIEKGYSLTKFVNKYGLRLQLLRRGFYFDELYGRWRIELRLLHQSNTDEN